MLEILVYRFECRSCLAKAILKNQVFKWKWKYVGVTVLRNVAQCRVNG
jgi:hypothetical protein